MLASPKPRRETPTPRTHFSRHAFERVLQRLTMTPDAVAHLLELNLTVLVAAEKKTNRVHRLFFSTRDSLCFVAIQDDVTKTVVTVLPIDYYQNLASRIHWSTLEEARELASRGVAPPKSQPELKKSPVAQKPLPKFHVKAWVDMPSGGRKIKYLGSWPAGPYSSDAEKAMEDPSFVHELLARAQLKAEGGSVRSLGLALRNREPSLLWVDADVLLHRKRQFPNPFRLHQGYQGSNPHWREIRLRKGRSLQTAAGL